MTSGAPHIPHRIGLIGHGAIGRSVARLLLQRPGYRLGVVTRSGGGAGQDPEVERFGDLDALLAWRPDVVVEAASAEAFAAYATACLAAGVDMIAASVGALQDADLMARIASVSERSGSRLIVPAGAVGGIDHIAAAALHPQTRVSYTSRKPVAAWTAELDALGLSDAVKSGPVTLYEGDARAAAARYPKNLNAGLTIALAAGFDRTLVRVVADPAADQNTHEIHISGPMGESVMSFRNTPDPDNPKTSAITAYSLASAVLRRFEVLQ